MKYTTFVRMFGEVARVLHHEMVDAAHRRFLNFFEKEENNEEYTPKQHLIKLSKQLGIDFTDLSGQLLDGIITDKITFEIDTPIQLTDTSETLDDVEVELKSPRFLKNSTHVKMKVEFVRSPAPEGWAKLQDALNDELHFSTKKPRKEP